MARSHRAWMGMLCPPPEIMQCIYLSASDDDDIHSTHIRLQCPLPLFGLLPVAKPFLLLCPMPAPLAQEDFAP